MTWQDFNHRRAVLRGQALRIEMERLYYKKLGQERERARNAAILAVEPRRVVLLQEPPKYPRFVVPVARDRFEVFSVNKPDAAYDLAVRETQVIFVARQERFELADGRDVVWWSWHPETMERRRW